MESKESGISADEGLSKIFAPAGRLLEAGQICRNENLSRTSKQISEYGVAAFYNGSIAVDLVTDIMGAGGILKMNDLKQCKSNLENLWLMKLKGLKILGMPPPSSGGTAVILVSFTSHTVLLA